MNRFAFKILLLCAAVSFPLPLPLRAADPASDEKEVIEVMRSMFAALAADDLPRFRAVTARDFYAYDIGKRFDGDALINLIKEAHADARVFVWNVTEPKVRVHADLAWITYVNEGSMQDSSGTKKMTWLESAILGKEDGAWRVQFLHSTRAAAAQ